MSPKNFLLVHIYEFIKCKILNKLKLKSLNLDWVYLSRINKEHRIVYDALEKNNIVRMCTYYDKVK